MLGVLIPPVVYLVILVLALVVPGRWVDGYVRDDAGKPLRYHLNGLRVFFLAIAAWAGVCKAGLLPWDALYTHRWTSVITACVIGLVLSAVVVFTAKVDTGRGALADYYLGRIPNPQYLGGRIDAKMYLYLVGATLLELNLLSFGAHHHLTHPADPSPGVFLYTALFTFFVTEYLNFEEVHLYTYDFFAERVGYKLTWGCLVFYPYFYAVGLWDVAELPNPHTPTGLLVGCAVIFFAGWSLARGANMQKFYFKTRPGHRLLGVISSEAIGDGERQLLVSGFWGLSRHINYLGEILMATGLALSLGYPGEIGPWLYPLYYLALLVPRQIDDDKRCEKKYGPLWGEYRKRVKYRIVPGVY